MRAGPRAILAALALVASACVTPAPAKLPPCWEPWEIEAEMEALLVFNFDLDDRPTQYVNLYRRVDYLDAYCSAANRAQGIPAPEAPKPWWQFWRR